MKNIIEKTEKQKKKIYLNNFFSDMAQNDVVLLKTRSF